MEIVSKDRVLRLMHDGKNVRKELVNAKAELFLKLISIDIEAEAKKGRDKVSVILGDSDSVRVIVKKALEGAGYQITDDLEKGSYDNTLYMGYVRWSD